MTSLFRADLHCHSICSDGSDTPLELLKLAKKAGLSGLSITDHDTIEAYSPEVLASAQEIGIQLLSGVELSTEFGNHTIHILGYGFDTQSKSLISFLEEMQRRRNERNRAILKKLASKNIIVTEEELATFVTVGVKKTIGRPHIAQIMLKKGYVRNLQEAFSNYLSEGTFYYVPGFKFTPLEAIQVIHEANGKAVLAHPHYIQKGRILNSLLDLPFDGIECYYGSLLEHQERPWIKIATDKNWIATGGSDYHGHFRPRISLGCSYVNEFTFKRLSNSF
ncbi:MAG TPA: PHP domain-containing protein [Chlamydiales bacterium]|nr:PHP domain-containing protein [Chlamydiales bacterium]